MGMSYDFRNSHSMGPLVGSDKGMPAETFATIMPQYVNEANKEGYFMTNVKRVCRGEGIIYEELAPIQRLFLTHYRCAACKLLPLYHVNITHPTKVRCGKCGSLISFRNSGKYGRIRKKIAFMHKNQMEIMYDAR